MTQDWCLIWQGQVPLHAACRNGHDEIVRLLLRAGVDPFLADECGSTPLDLARDWQRTQIQTMLQGMSCANAKTAFMRRHCYREA